MNTEETSKPENIAKDFTPLVNDLEISDLFKESDLTNYISFHHQLISCAILIDDKTLESISEKIRSFENTKRVGEIINTCKKVLDYRKTQQIAIRSFSTSKKALYITAGALIVNIVFELIQLIPC